MGKSKLHELLAVRNDKLQIFKKILAETQKAFLSKEENFTGEVKTLVLYDDEENTKLQETGANVTNNRALTTTVAKRLDYTAKSIADYFDVILQQETSNQTAVADIVVYGVTIAEAVPATFLLSLESNLKAIRDVFDCIPTLLPGKDWIQDPDYGEGAYSLRKPDKSFRTKASVVPSVLYEATPEHPAQVKEVSETKNVGVYTISLVSGMMSPAEKSQLLDRVDSLIQAVKKARRRANNVEAATVKAGEKLTNFILGKDEKEQG